MKFNIKLSDAIFLPVVLIYFFSCSSKGEIKKEDISRYRIKGRCASGDCINGKGTKVYSGGIRYSGEFKGNKPSGKGTFSGSNGVKYTGEFKNGKISWEREMHIS